MNISVRYRVSEEFYESAEKAGLYKPMVTECERILSQYLKTDKKEEQNKPRKCLGKDFEEILQNEMGVLNEKKGDGEGHV